MNDGLTSSLVTLTANALGLALLCVSVAQAQPDDGAQCGEEGETISLSRYLRAISLDLRGEPPTVAEYDRVEAAGEVPADLLDEMLDSDRFAWRFVEFHKSLLWPYVGSTLSLTPIKLDLDSGNPYGTGSMVWFRGYPANTAAYRGREYTPCRNEPEPDPANIQLVDMPDGTRREGYVCVRPYHDSNWDPEDIFNRGDCPLGEYKVCALDAQTHLVSPTTGARCDTVANASDPGCGCGPGLQWCGRFGQFGPPLLASFFQQIRWIIDNDRPYHELLTESPPIVNGPLAHYYRVTAPHLGYDLPVSPALVPLMEYTESNRWVALDAGPAARGIFSHPIFLARFMTRRARADRYYNSFLCQPFQPPSSGITVGNAPDPDLQRREGCKYCHSIIEPAGAHWGRYSEYGASYLDPGRYPDFDPECLRCAVTGLCSQRCLREYVVTTPTGTEAPWLGYLRAFLYRQDEHVANINGGPALMVRRHLSDGRFGRCTARNAVVWLTGRQPKDDELSWIDALATDFAEAEYDYKHLVRAIVTSEFYRRVR